MDFEKIVQTRYAVKLFQDKKVPEDKVNKLLELVRFAPSSYNFQPWKILVISDRKLLDKLVPASFNQTQVKTCSHLLVFCADSDLATKIKKIKQNALKHGATEDKIKNYIGMLENVDKELSDEEKVTWSQRQLFLALGNALNGAISLGFDSSPMEGFEPEEYQKILKLPKNIVPTALCALGYAADKPMPKIRLPKEEVFMYFK